jgi:Rrf2 family iron-sulfur cluster assembly transcriptional regulator
MRLEMSNRTDLVLRVIGHLDSTGASTGSALAASIGTTINYLPQVVKPLIVEGWICSTPGPGGGYRLCAHLEDISVLEVIEAVEGQTEDNQCVLRGAPCPTLEPCVLHDSWVKARGALLAELATTSVRETLVAAPKKGE